MRKESYAIPDGCKKITVESDQSSLIVIFERMKPCEFVSDITEEIEESPTIGDISIFWNEETTDRAIIAKCKNWERLDQTIAYESSDGNWYNNAVRFRNSDQYERIINAYKAK